MKTKERIKPLNETTWQSEMQKVNESLEKVKRERPLKPPKIPKRD